MDDRLLVRIYNVGLGDFIYLRVPDRRRQVHIVIDCGNKAGSFDLLAQRFNELKEDLPTVRGKKRIDLLVVTHPHEDHHKGFDPVLFEDVRIERIWLSPAFNRLDPHAQAFHALQDAALRALHGLAAEVAALSVHDTLATRPQLVNSPTSQPSNPELQTPPPELLSLAELLAINNDEAFSALCHTLPAKNGIEPLYVSADTPPEKLKIFRDPHIQLKVLAPMGDIDAYYLGGAGLNLLVEPAAQPASLPGFGPSPELDANPNHALSDPADVSSAAASAYAALFPFAPAVGAHAGAPLLEPQPGDMAGPQDMAAAAATFAAHTGSPWMGSAPGNTPANISSQDFRRLQDRVRPNALAAVEIAGHTVNNLSVTLLLEWRGRRLLFPGDAEWYDGRQIEIKPGRSNGSWNVMWHARRAELSKPLDFLKIGHHGSVNATPWHAGHPISVILDALLPLPAPGQTPVAHAVASTKRTSLYPSIPDPALMAELGRRVANARREYTEPKTGKHVGEGIPQPQRTDLEGQTTGSEISYIELSFSE